MTGRVYTIDSSSVIYLVRNHPRDIFGTLWANLEALAEDRRLFVHQLVIDELDVKDDDAAKWVKSLPKSCRIDLDSDQAAFITRLGNDYRHMWHRLQDYDYANSAAPFIVAIGVTRGFCVITEESPLKAWKIPDLCRRYNVTPVNRYGLMREEGWYF